MNIHLSLFMPIIAIASAVSASEPVAQRASLKLTESPVSAADYPASALALRQEGIVVAAFLVDPNGKVTSCNIAQSSGSDALDQRTCEIVIQRFQFSPARTAQGRAVEEWRTQKFSWRLPAGSVGDVGSSKHGELLVHIARDGRVESCEASKSSGDRLWDLRMCKVVSVNRKFEPARDRFGRRQKSRQVVPVWE